MNQTFKMTAIAAALAMTAGVASANQFEASSLVTYSSKKTLVSDGTSVKQLVGPTVVESGLWQGTASVKSYVTIHFPKGLDLNGFAGTDAAGTGGFTGLATDKVVTAKTNLRSAATAGTKYEVRVGKKVSANIDTTGAATSEAAAFVYVKGVGGATNAHVIAGAVASDSTAAITTNGYRLASLNASVANDVAGTTTLAAAAINAKAPWLANFADGAAPTDDTDTKVGEFVVNADGSADLTLALRAQDATSASDTVLALPNFYASVPSGTANGDLSIVINDGDTAGANGLGVTQTTVAVAQSTSTIAAVAKTTSTDTVPNGLLGSLAPQKLLGFTITFAAAESDVHAEKLVVKLNNGAKFKSGASELSGAVSKSGSVGLVLASTTPTVASDGSLEIPFHATASAIADGDTIALAGALLDLSGVTAEGDIIATITATSGVSNFGTQTFTVAKAVKGGVTSELVDDATAGLPTVYAGRTGVTINEGIKLSEVAPGSLTQYGSVVLAASSGAKFTASDTINSSLTTYMDNITVPSTATATVQSGIKASSAGGTAQKITIDNFSFNLADATPGKLSVTISGTSGAAGTIDLANIVNATTASVSGTQPVAVQGSTVALPEIVIVEAQKAAVDANGTKQAVIATAISQVSSFDVSAAKVRAYSADGTEVSTAVLGSSTGISLTAFANSSTNTSGVFFKPAAASGSNEGAVTFKITGLKAVVGSSATGDLKFTVAGVSDSTGALAATTANIGLSVAAGADGQIGSDVGAKLTKQEIKVGSVVGSKNPAYPTVTVADVTKAVLAGIPLVAAGDDQGKQGAIYVVFIYNGTVFFMDNAQQWKLYTGATPAAYATGTLGSTSIDVIKTAEDLSSLKGGQLIIGYGLGIAGLGDPFKNMLDNVRYNVAYEVK